MNKSYLASLKKQKRELISEWVNLVSKSTTRYQTVAKKDVEKNISLHFEAIIDIIEKEDYSRLNEFLESLARERSELGFDITETQLAFLHGQTVLLRFLDLQRKDDKIFCANSREVTDIFYKTQLLYSNIFKRIQLESTAQDYTKKIESNNLRLSTVTDDTKDAVIGLDENLMICSWNRSAESMYRYKAAEVIGKSFEILTTSDQKKEKELQTLLNRVSHNGFVKNYQTERVRKDGKAIIVDANWTQLKNEKNNYTGYSIIHHDLTEKIQMQREISSQGQYWSSVVDHSVDAIIGIDLNDTIVSWNKGAENIFGYSKDEIVGKNFDILLPPEAKKSGELQKINAELNKTGFVRNYEAERISKSGKRISTLLTRSLIRNRDHEIIGSSAMLRDITEYKKLKMQMSHSEKLSVVGQLAAGIAHEVGNPLTSISSLIQVLVRSTKDEDLKKNLSLIKKQTDRISRLIHELVTFSQPSDFNICPANINDLVTEAVTIIKYDKHARNSTLVVKLDNDLPITEVPKDQLQQVFINILLNALEALPDQDGKVSVNTGTKNGSIQVIVKDNGRGIPESIIGRIFDPFFTTKGVGKGTGLGLWVSYGIIENLRGKILVESKEKSGSTFTVEIPITT